MVRVAPPSPPDPPDRAALEQFTERLAAERVLSPGAIKDLHEAGHSSDDIGRAVGRALGSVLKAGEVLEVVKLSGVEPPGDVLRGFMAGRLPEHNEETSTVDGGGDDSGEEEDKVWAVIEKFEKEFKETHTLWSGGRLDRLVVDAYAYFVKRPDGGPSVLDTFGTRARKAGVDPVEIEGFIGVVQRQVLGRGIRLVPAAEIMAQPDPRFLIEGLIEEGGLPVLYSEPKLGKTFVVLSWCYCVASGRPWLGRPVIQGPVVYVGAEGVGGLPKRLRALVDHYGDEAPPPHLYVISQPVNLWA
jgi:hypothetical protein